TSRPAPKARASYAEPVAAGCDQPPAGGGSSCHSTSSRSAPCFRFQNITTAPIAAKIAVILNSLRKNPPFFSAVSSPIEGPLPAISERARVFVCVGTVSLASMPLGDIPAITQRVGLDGLEPSTSSLSGKRSNRAELQAPGRA